MVYHVRTLEALDLKHSACVLPIRKVCRYDLHVAEPVLSLFGMPQTVSCEDTSDERHCKERLRLEELEVWVVGNEVGHTRDVGEVLQW